MRAASVVDRIAVAKPSKTVKVRAACFNDYSGVVALEAKFGLASKSYEEWTHLWSDNPAYREVRGWFPIGWVLEDGEENVVGYLGNIPQHYEFEGRQLLAASTRAWMVDPAYRTYALLLLGAYFKQPNVDLLINTTVNPQAARAHNFFEGFPSPVGAWDQSLFWITNARGFTESFLQKKGIGLGRALSYPLSWAVSFQERLKPRKFSRKGNSFQVVACPEFDGRFDGFWDSLRKKRSNQLLAVRNRESLAWHFKSSLPRNRAWIYTVADSADLAAYAVFVRKDSPEAGLTRMRLADFECLDQEKAPAIFMAMLKVAMDRCGRESIHMLEVIGQHPAMENDVARAFPHRRRLPNCRYFYKATGSLLAEKLKDPAVWDPTLFDGDGSL